jgi:hypothetical protein
MHQLQKLTLLSSQPFPSCINIDWYIHQYFVPNRTVCYTKQTTHFLKAQSGFYNKPTQPTYQYPPTAYSLPQPSVMPTAVISQPSTAPVQIPGSYIYSQLPSHAEVSNQPFSNADSTMRHQAQGWTQGQKDNESKGDSSNFGK